MTLNSLVWTLGGALGGTLLTTPLVREWARRTGRVARPKADRWHTQATALMGGIAMFAGFAAGIAVALAVMGRYAPEGELRAVLGIGIAAAIMFATGVADDLWQLRPTSKLVLQGLAGAALVTLGARFVVTPWEPVNAVVTLFWFIALTNALNLLDNMDGVTAGVAAVGGATFALLFALQGDWLLALTGVALLGAGAGFLPFNFRPASIFMGDSGSLFLGAVLAGLGSAYSAAPGTGPTLPGVLIPLLVAVVPLLDTILVTVTRTRARIPITQGGRDHVAHRLVSMGLSERTVALLLYGLAAAGGACAVMTHGRAEWSTPWLVALFALAVVVFGAYLTRLYTYAPEDSRRAGRMAILLEALLFRRRALEVLFDLVVFAVAYSGAYVLRWDSQVPGSQVELLSGSVAVAVACKSIAFAVCGVYRGIWHRLALHDVHRILKAVAVGTVLTIVAVVFGFREADYSRSVFLLDGLLVVVFAVGIRMSFRSLDHARVTLRMTGNGARTLIYGAGRAGDLAVRELHANPALGLEPVAFVDDDRSKRGCLVQGLAVLGEFHDMERLIPQHRITRVVVSTGKLPEARWRSLTRLCHEHRVDLLALEVKIATLREEPRVSVAHLTAT